MSAPPADIKRFVKEPKFEIRRPVTQVTESQKFVVLFEKFVKTGDIYDDITSKLKDSYFTDFADYSDEYSNAQIPIENNYSNLPVYFQVDYSNCVAPVNDGYSFVPIYIPDNYSSPSTIFLAGFSMHGNKIPVNNMRINIANNFSDKIISIGNSIYTVVNAPSYIQENINKLKTVFDKELEKNSNYIKSNRAAAIEQIGVIINELANINFQSVTVELSQLNTLKFKVKLNENIKIYITHFFENDNFPNDKGVLYTLFQKRKVVASDVSNLSDLVEETNKYLSENL